MADDGMNYDEAIRDVVTMCEDARRISQEIAGARNKIRHAAAEEGAASLAAEGVILRKTVLRLPGERYRAPTRDQRVVVQYVACENYYDPDYAPRPNWASSEKWWWFRVGLAYVRTNGELYADGMYQTRQVSCDRPSELGAALLERFPLWANAEAV